MISDYNPLSITKTEEGLRVHWLGEEDITSYLAEALEAAGCKRTGRRGTMYSVYLAATGSDGRPCDDGKYTR